MKGIQIGASRAVGGLVDAVGVGIGGGSGSTESLGKVEQKGSKRRWKGRKKGEAGS